MTLEAPGQFPVDFFIEIFTEYQCKVALEAPGQLPVYILIKTFLKSNAKWPWRTLGSFLYIS